MLDTELMKIIDKYIDERYYDKDKLVKYLDMHDIVGNEIFQYCDKKKIPYQEGSRSYSSYLDQGGFVPVDVNTFVRRIPFYFYVADADMDMYGDLTLIIGELNERDEDFINPERLEKLYRDMEWALYDLGISQADIISYMLKQHIEIGCDYLRWFEYLRMCETLQWTDYTPKRFITAYNWAREALGMDPIIYYIDEVLPGEYMFRDKNTITFEGNFPCDDEGKPIMRWIGLSIRNAANISCTCKKSEYGKLIVTITPDTIIQANNIYDEENKDIWYQLYAGPLTMEMDSEVIKYHRKHMGYTQQEVADAIGASLRTYQKWESGVTKPDGHYLLRLMNWLDITDPQDIVKYNV